MQISEFPTLGEPDAAISVHTIRARKEIERRCYALAAWRKTDPPFVIAPLIAVRFVMRDTLDPADFQTAWPDFMAGYRQHFRAGGLRAANAFALRKLSDLGTRSNRSGQ